MPGLPSRTRPTPRPTPFAWCPLCLDTKGTKKSRRWRARLKPASAPLKLIKLAPKIAPGKYFHCKQYYFTSFRSLASLRAQPKTTSSLRSGRSDRSILTVSPARLSETPPSSRPKDSNRARPSIFRPQHPRRLLTLPPQEAPRRTPSAGATTIRRNASALETAVRIQPRESWSRRSRSRAHDRSTPRCTVLPLQFSLLHSHLQHRLVAKQLLRLRDIRVGALYVAGLRPQVIPLRGIASRLIAGSMPSARPMHPKGMTFGPRRSAP